MGEGHPDAVKRAEAFTEGGEAGFDEVAELAAELRRRGRFAPIAPMLIAAGRRAIYEGWEQGRRTELALLLRGHEQFGYARRLLGRVREGEDSELLRQQHALCTYKDMELPAARRLDRALQILEEGGRPLRESTSAETLGIAGAIYKRRWEVDAMRADLESALWCYEQGYRQEGDPERDYAGINAAFVADRLAKLEQEGLGDPAEVDRLRAVAGQIRTEIAGRLTGGDGGWDDSTLGEACFGLGRFEAAEEHLARVRGKTKERWQLQTTALQLAALGPLRGFTREQTAGVLKALLGDPGGAIQRADAGKVGLALSGGGFRASLFHIGVLARLAECNVLRRVEVLSCVSGGSIVGAHYYLRLRQLLESKADGEVGDEDYVDLVRALADEFLDGVRGNVRGHLFTNPVADLQMLASSYSRTDRAGELFEKAFFAGAREDGAGPSRPWRMTDLYVKPSGTGEDFSMRYENWLREAKVPMLVLNATTLNTGHIWQFTASWMGEPPIGVDEAVDASYRLRRVYYRDAPEGHREPALGTAVAASACVPGLFPPIALRGLYKGVDVELVDGGVHDNQGIASLLEQDCTVVLVSDASGQAADEEHPSRWLLKVAKRSNSILMGRVRGAQYDELSERKRLGLLRGLMVVHMKKGLSAPPHDWIGCKEPYRSEDDALAPGVSNRPDYGIDEDVQRALAELRTDLDAFSDDEAYSLMAAGYAMAKYELAQALPEMCADAQPGRDLAWPFAAALKRLGDPGSRDSLLDALRPGHARFFRRIAAWKMRWQEKNKPDTV